MKTLKVLRAVVIDDDSAVYRLIKRAVENHCPDISVVAKATGVVEGIRVINDYAPDLVFLDILMADGNGFDLIEHFYKPGFKVILISGFNEYALKGYKFNAIDYIMKPIREDELIRAISKAVEHIRDDNRVKPVHSGDEAEAVRNHHKIILKTLDQIHIINTSDILHIEADRNYSTLFLEEGRKLVVSRPIKEFEDALSDRGFHRIHKSHIININKVSFFNRPEGGTVVLKDGSIVPVASRKRDFLISLFNNL